MTALNSLTKKRRGFLNQIYNIVDNQFKKLLMEKSQKI